MSRHGYSDDCEGWQLVMWRGAVTSAMYGKRGQAFLRDLADAMDAMPEKRLIADELIKVKVENPLLPWLFCRGVQDDPERTWLSRWQPAVLDFPVDGGVCAIGALAQHRGTDVSRVALEDHDGIGNLFNIAPAMVAEIVFMNDEASAKTPKARWREMRLWVNQNLRKTSARA